MAKKATKKASNLFVWIILGLLVVGLAGFGTTNFGGSVRSVASVGKSEVDIETYARALQTEMQRMSQATGQQVTMADAQAMGLDGQVLQRLLAETALNEAARAAGLSVGDEAVGDQILEIPAFAGPNGSFDRQAYEFMLDQNGLSVGEFEDQIRAELSRSLLQQALVSGVVPDPAFGETLYVFLAQTRSVTAATLSSGILLEPLGTPTDEQVQSFYDEHHDLFTLPERKAITYVWLTPEILAETIDVSDADIAAAFEARKSEFSRPERRMVDRLAFSDESSAQAAADAIAAGETTFGALLDERGLTEADVDQGVVTEAQLDEAGSGVFGLEDTGIVGPLPSSVGPAIFRVNAILSATEETLEDVSDQLRHDIAMDRAEGMIEDEYSALDDMLAGGATLEELADNGDVELGSIDWTGSGTAGPAGYAAFIEAANAVTENDFPEIGHLDNGGIFALRLDGVKAPELQPLDEVHEEAMRLTAEDSLNTALLARGEELLPELESGGDFGELGLLADSYTDFSRRQPPADLPVAASEAAFEMAEGETRLVETEAGPMIVRLDRITAPDLNTDEAKQIRDSLSADATQGMVVDILTAFARSIEREAGITTNDAALNAVHTQLP